MKKLLIANRGEIACRIARTARAHGIATVAVYTDVDAAALHVQACDDAVALGREGQGRSPYLDIAALLSAAQAAGADAVHPGYGFLSERADFANAVIAAGLTWVGPPPEVMAALGRKDAAKALARALGVPVVPGFEIAAGAVTDATVAQCEAASRSTGRRNAVRRPPSQEIIALDDEGLGAAERARRTLDAERDASKRTDLGADWQPVGATAADLGDLAAAVGYPVIIKAVAGGGGRGMRVVRDPAQLLATVVLAAREAQDAFGDAGLLVEKYFERGRHVEVQILADADGRVLHLGERECSIQRRHQKLVEESPCVVVTPELREAMTKAALQLAVGVGYVSAGTVEFLLDEASGHFYFLEVNTRIQVEHAVTEMVTGLDLVAWQLWIAQGQALTIAQHDVVFDGHAVEVRLCAEDPRNDMQPQAGPILRWQPPEGEGLRVDHGLHATDRVPVNYDSLVAKIVAWGPDRTTALGRLARALRRTRLLGLQTNRGLLEAIVTHRDMAIGDLTTHWLADHAPRQVPVTPEPLTLVAAALWRSGEGLTRRYRSNASRPDVTVLAVPGAEPTPTPVHVALQPLGGNRFAWGIEREPDPLLWRVPALTGEVRVLRKDAEGIELAWENGKRHWDVVAEGTSGGDRLWLHADAEGEVLLYEGTLLPMPRRLQENLGAVTAPGAAVVVEVHVAQGDSVQADAPLVTLESMKMLHILRAPRSGTIASVRAVTGESVATGAVLVAFEAQEAPVAAVA